MINKELADSGLADDVLDEVFEMWWPRLEEQVQKLLENFEERPSPMPRSERDLLEEILELTRSLP